MNNLGQNVRIDVDTLPELDTEVAIAGASRQQEVGGGLCLGIIAGVAVYIGTS